MSRTIQRVYVERAVSDHPRVEQILRRFPKAEVVECERYGEVFNRRGQDFRLQKARPSLILAAKTGRKVYEAPAGYGVGGARNYYFSHMLNCVYDCRYCFLQGMFRSAHYVVFVNYEDFQEEIAETVDRVGESWFFSGYDCDSLAFDSVTDFGSQFLTFFARHPRAWLELRTKSVQVEALRSHEPISNCVLALSFTPESSHREFEHGVPSVARRLSVARELQKKGWKIGLRFDPLLDSSSFEEAYRQLFEQTFRALDADTVHSVSLGGFRLPKPFFKRLTRLHPEEPLLAQAFEDHEGLIGFPSEREREMVGFCTEELARWVGSDVAYLCTLPPSSS